jgi:PAS domain S-box-containing protein
VVNQTEPPFPQDPAFLAALQAFLLNATSDLFMVTDGTGQIVFANPACAQMSGWGQRDLIGRFVIDLVAFEDHAYSVEAARRICAGETSISTTWRLKLRDGASVPISWNVTMVGGFAFAIGRDVTEVARTKQALAAIESEALAARHAAEEARIRLELALEAGHAAAWQLDFDSGQLFVSKQFEALIGRPVTVEEMMTGRGAATHPDDVALTLACTKKLIEKPSRATIEHRIVRPDGEIRWVQSICQTIADHTGRLVRAVALTVDITEQRTLQDHLLVATRQAEAALAQRRALIEGVASAPEAAPVAAAEVRTDGFRELFDRFTRLIGELDQRDAALAQTFVDLREAHAAAEAASVAKSEFLANMSHELRTPINAIIGFGELIGDDAAGREPQISEDATRIVAAANRLLQMINELLDLAKLESGRLRAKPLPADLAVVVKSVVAQARAGAIANGNRIAFEAGDDLAGLVDPERLSQALRHIVDNACKFTRNGDISVRAETIGSGGDRRGVITVRDSGIGMTPDEVQKLRAPLTQLDARSNRRAGGAGLGLALVRRLCDLLGGALQIDSALQEGTVVVLEFQFPAMQDSVAA